jgi:hypothetical protein
VISAVVCSVTCKLPGVLMSTGPTAGTGTGVGCFICLPTLKRNEYSTSVPVVQLLPVPVQGVRSQSKSANKDPITICFHDMLV